MRVQQRRTCSLCSHTKTCFVFDEFEVIFSCCFSCFKEIQENLEFIPPNHDYCSLCGHDKEIKGMFFDNSLFFSPFLICSSCNNQLKSKIMSKFSVKTKETIFSHF